MADKAGHQGGREKTVEKAAVKNEIPAQSKKRKRQKAPEGLPDHKTAQDEQKEVPSHSLMRIGNKNGDKKIIYPAL